ncbi:MAG: Omp28-related outer membrane protein [Muribaculaceae bacterium]|nr:Omp28-related outer membrane protein [Muribaculaceae bacterium]
MKRTLLTLTTAAAVTSAFALSTSTSHLGRQVNHLNPRNPLASYVENKTTRQQNNILLRAGSDQELSMEWGYCEGIQTALPMAPGEFKGAIILPAEVADQFAGAVLSSISVGNPVDASTVDAYYNYENPIREATVWLAESFDDEPFVSAKGELGEDGFGWSTIELPEPYTLKAGTPVIIGYTIDIPENNGEIYAVLTDYSYDVNGYSFWIYSNYAGWDDEGYLIFDGDPRWQDVAEDFGNIAIRARISGDMLPVNKVTTVGYQAPQYAAPGEPFNILSMVRNDGANLVTSVEYTLEVQDMAPQTYTVEINPPLEYNAISDVLSMEFVCDTKGNNISYELYISALNGEKLAEHEAPMSGTLLCIEDGYPKNNVFEEATGTWCGWCVYGYAGMEYMSEHYSDLGFIGIAVHNDAQMGVTGEGQAYEEFGTYVSGYPSAYVNRDMGNDVYPAPEELEDEFNWIRNIPAYATISATIEAGESDNVIKLSTVTEFGDTEGNTNYQIGYTVVENGVGPYPQQNYCSGAGYDCYGFENMDPIVLLTFNDVARNCSKPMGIEGSLPASVEQGQKYTYETEITLDDVTEPKNARVVAMVINKNNGAIENACSVNISELTDVNKLSVSKEEVFVYGTKGALNFRVNASKANVYTIDGRCVTNGVKGNSLRLPAGVYIVTLNGKTCKVAVR